MEAAGPTGPTAAWALDPLGAKWNISCATRPGGLSGGGLHPVRWERVGQTSGWGDTSWEEGVLLFRLGPMTGGQSLGGGLMLLGHHLDTELPQEMKLLV